MILPMLRIQIVGLKRDAPATLQALHVLGCVELDKTAVGGATGLVQFAPTKELIQEQEQLGHLAAQVDSLQLALAVEAQIQSCGEVPDLANLTGSIQNKIEPLLREVRGLVQLRDDLEAELAALPRYEETLRRLVPLVPRAAHEHDNVSTILIVPQQHQWLLAEMRTKLEALGDSRVITVEENISESMRAMLVVAPREKSEAITALVGQRGISQLQLPDEVQGLAPDAAVVTLRKKLNTLPETVAKVEGRLEELAAEWGDALNMYRVCLGDKLAEIRALDQLGMTEFAFVLQAWTTEPNLLMIESRLLEQSGEAFVLETLPYSAEVAGTAPVALENPGPARPFERLVGIYAWPGRRDVDPTFLMALFMPFFFGIILGDIGYGVLVLALALFLLWRVRKAGAVRDISKTLAFGAVWAILFGFLYGELFGSLGESMGMEPIWISRYEPDDVAVLLLFAVALGALHVTLGLLLGLWQAIQTRSRSHLLERAGMLVCMAGLFALVATLTKLLPAGLMTPSLALVVVGIVILGSSFGWLGLLLGPLEFIGLVGNVLSYLRLAAVGLASAYVAMVANSVAGGLGVVVIGVIIAVLIHTLNLALGAFSPTIHSMRLHYVEFFSKFYTGGGRPFKPFKSQLPHGEQT